MGELKALQNENGWYDALYHDHVGKVSLVGAGTGR